MFQSLKTHTPHTSNWRDIPNAYNFHISPGARTGNPKGNEASRMVRCRICGFPCDKERDSKAREGSWAGLGVSYSAQQTAASSPRSDGRSIGAGAQAQKADKYYNRTIAAGCPSCGCLTYYL